MYTYISGAEEKRAVVVAIAAASIIVLAAIAGLSSIYPRGIVQLFTEFISFSLLIPFIIGAVLVSLGLYLKIVGDTVAGYGVLMGIGAAILVGFIGIVLALMTSPL